MIIDAFNLHRDRKNNAALGKNLTNCLDKVGDSAFQHDAWIVENVDKSVGDLNPGNDGLKIR